MTNISINLNNQQAEVLYTILVSHVDDVTGKLKSRGVLNGDGTRKKTRKYYSDFEQSLLDELTLADGIYKYIEPQLEVFKSHE